mmetsp:Transcript_1022/g.3219  ORF Transcript_1022/g.3219 Transcript_1022/m.3219 type:complete len:248 (+) Transcript_1022:2572-3315(+)
MHERPDRRHLGRGALRWRLLRPIRRAAWPGRPPAAGRRQGLYRRGPHQQHLPLARRLSRHPRAPRRQPARCQIQHGHPRPAAHLLHPRGVVPDVLHSHQEDGAHHRLPRRPPQVHHRRRHDQVGRPLVRSQLWHPAQGHVVPQRRRARGRRGVLRPGALWRRGLLRLRLPEAVVHQLWHRPARCHRRLPARRLHRRVVRHGPHRPLQRRLGRHPRHGHHHSGHVHRLLQGPLRALRLAVDAGRVRPV